MLWEGFVQLVILLLKTGTLATEQYPRMQLLNKIALINLVGLIVNLVGYFKVIFLFCGEIVPELLFESCLESENKLVLIGNTWVCI